MNYEITPHEYAMSLADKGHSAQSIKQATGVDLTIRRERPSFQPFISVHEIPVKAPEPTEKYGPPSFTMKMKVDALIRDVAMRNGIKPEDITGRSNLRIHAYPRHEAMYLMLQKYGLSLSHIGRLLDNRDHSTVQFGINGHCNRNGLDYAAVRRPVKVWVAPVIPSRPKFDQYYKPRTAREYVLTVGVYAS